MRRRGMVAAILLGVAVSCGSSGTQEEFSRAQQEIDRSEYDAAISRLDALVLLGEARPAAITRVRSDLERQANWLSSHLGGADGFGDVEMVSITSRDPGPPPINLEAMQERLRP